MNADQQAYLLSLIDGVQHVGYRQTLTKEHLLTVLGKVRHFIAALDAPPTVERD